jgi:hypothetical protein
MDELGDGVLTFSFVRKKPKARKFPDCFGFATFPPNLTKRKRKASEKEE